MTVSSEVASSLPWRRITDALGCGLLLVDQAGLVVHWNAWMAKHSGIASEAALGLTLEAAFGEPLTNPFKRALANVLRHKLPAVLSNVLHRDPLPLYRNPGVDTLRMPQSVMLMPIQAEDGGPLCLIQITDTSMFVKRERVLQSNSDRLSKEAVIDGLTGVYNRKYFNEKLPAELARCARQQQSMSLLMLDVDDFKKYNDNHGHPAGDRVLVAIITAAHSQLNRASDILARYGGEEFAMILTACDKAGALLVAERIRHAISELRIPHLHAGASEHVTVSLGAATSGPGAHCSPGELLDAADRALYQSKRGGRNTVHWLPGGAISQALPPPAA
ncbi:hypothetical protein RD110_13510 [Rhodoferax koreense]|uniref:diguanylate cyclase n=1 Tax=Rhodoferax koreensis TaxID=1842727 RepID=A0A1P8JWE2_9BURK|nr:diguanylate cyclase [Rhodoferax koreense]APW38086.1 hypothetical protein RD110_13510 [Rhodoferax koreense]